MNTGISEGVAILRDVPPLEVIRASIPTRLLGPKVLGSEPFLIKALVAARMQATEGHGLTKLRTTNASTYLELAKLLVGGRFFLTT